MGLFSRHQTKKDQTVSQGPPAATVPAEPVKTHRVTFKCPQYFKADKGKWYVFFDGKPYEVEPMHSVSMDLPEGRHTVRVYSYPETLADLSADVDVDREMVLSVSVNVLNGTMKMFDYQHNITIKSS